MSFLRQSFASFFVARRVHTASDAVEFAGCRDDRAEVEADWELNRKREKDESEEEGEAEVVNCEV